MREELEERNLMGGDALAEMCLEKASLESTRVGTSDLRKGSWSGEREAFMGHGHMYHHLSINHLFPPATQRMQGSLGSRNRVAIYT